MYEKKDIYYTNLVEVFAYQDCCNTKKILYTEGARDNNFRTLGFVFYCETASTSVLNFSISFHNKETLSFIDVITHFTVHVCRVEALSNDLKVIVAIKVEYLELTS